MADEGILCNRVAEELALDAVSDPTPELGPGSRIEGIVIATLVAVRDQAALIHYSQLDEDQALLASTAQMLMPEDVGKQLAVVFIGGDPDQPLVLGKLAQRLLPGSTERRRERELVLEADRKITIRCGRSSISLTRDGRLELRGQHLLSRADSVNRIRGGVIQLN